MARLRIRGGPFRANIGCETLATQAEALDECAVSVDVDILQVTQQAATLADKQKQATT